MTRASSGNWTRTASSTIRSSRSSSTCDAGHFGDLAPSDFSLGHFQLRGDRNLLSPLHAWRTPSRELDGAKTCEDRELECVDSNRTLYHTNLLSEEGTRLDTGDALSQWKTAGVTLTPAKAFGEGWAGMA